MHRYYSDKDLSPKDQGSPTRLEKYQGIAVDTAGTTLCTSDDVAAPFSNPDPVRFAQVAMNDALSCCDCISQPDNCYCGSHLFHYKYKHFTQVDYDERCHNCTTATTTLTTTPTTTPITTIPIAATLPAGKLCVARAAARRATAADLAS